MSAKKYPKALLTKKIPAEAGRVRGNPKILLARQKNLMQS